MSSNCEEKDLPVVMVSPAMDFAKALLSLFNVSICEYVEASAKPETDRDNIVANKLT